MVVPRYVIIKASSIEELEEKVNDAMTASGYIPTGGVVVHKESYSIEVFLQALCS